MDPIITPTKVGDIVMVMTVRTPQVMRDFVPTYYAVVIPEPQYQSQQLKQRRPPAPLFTQENLEDVDVTDIGTDLEETEI